MLDLYSPNTTQITNLLPTQNFLFTSRSEDAHMKLIDFGLSDFIRPGNYHEIPLGLKISMLLLWYVNKTTPACFRLFAYLP